MTSTERLYIAAQREFKAWCSANDLRVPTNHANVAKYLKRCRKAHGPTSMKVHRAAIAQLYRAKGIALDTKLLMELINAR